MSVGSYRVGNRRLVSFDVSWHSPIESAGPWHLLRCSSTRRVVMHSKVNKLQAMQVWIEVGQRSKLGGLVRDTVGTDLCGCPGYRAISPKSNRYLEVDARNLYAYGPLELAYVRWPVEVEPTGGDQPIRVTDVATGYPVYEGRLDDWSCPPGTEDDYVRAMSTEQRLPTIGNLITAKAEVTKTLAEGRQAKPENQTKIGR